MTPINADEEGEMGRAIRGKDDKINLVSFVWYLHLFHRRIISIVLDAFSPLASGRRLA